MSRDIWNPRQYRAYSSHRARPFYELLARVDVEDPAYVVDLGCGPGERTADLAARWPSAVVEGIDSSEQMISEARRMLRAARAAVEPAGDVVAEEEGGGDAGSSGRLGAGAEVDTAAADGAVRDVETRITARAQPAESAVLPADVVGSRPPRSGQMADANPGGGGSLEFSVGDLAEWAPDRPVDVIFSNAALQWVPGHQRLLPRWVEALTPGGRLAFSMPGNFDGPSHTLLRELCESPRWHDRLGEVNRHNIVDDPAEYYELLTDLGCDVDAWETTYLQVLHGTDPVLEWMKGTALRPALNALAEGEERADFLAELAPLLREAYPPGPHGTIFPFRRVFVVAVTPSR
ncbi:MAG TPA: methyltransferase domain-containing protein [Actinoallomurus sp.]|jgi:trans-aconitate 2-methyltransferase